MRLISCQSASPPTRFVWAIASAQDAHLGRDARGKSPGAPIGNANARKHGFCTADAIAIAERRDLAALIRSMRKLVEEIDGKD